MKIARDKPGDSKIRRGFLLFPKTVNYETRWLEKATWEVVYKRCLLHSEWEAIKWID